MSVITAIFQAIAQALSWIFPISENGHSSIFHDFSGRFTDACSQLTGIIHIGIAIGILIAFYKLFLNLFKSFFVGWNDLFHKNLKIKEASSVRRFMFMTILSFSLMIFYLIPVGKKGNLYTLLNYTTYNGNLLSEGICFALTGVLLIVALSVIDKQRKPLPQALQAVLIGVGAFFAIPTAGCSLVGAVFSIAILTGFSEKYAIRYSMVMSVPVLVVIGIVELCVGVTKVNVVTTLVALVISACVAFFAVKMLVYIISNRKLKYIAIYDISIGVICALIGIFEIAVK